MKTLLNSFLKKRYQKRRSPMFKPSSGFTMIELLVATVITTIIIVPMLTFVVDILNRDVREQAKTNSEQELQAAVDYIAQDMSQAFYIYDDTYLGDSSENPPKPSYQDFLISSGLSENRPEPILVFWKREFMGDSVPIPDPNCQNDCYDDTFVQSLVAYYLIDDNNNTWCQPSGNPCPKRIARFQIQDGVRDTKGNYLCTDDGGSFDCEDKFKRDMGYTPYNNENPTAWTKASGETYTDNLIVLVNYIETEGFTLDSVSDDKKLAKITIQGNALRRIQPSAPECTSDFTFCPRATAQVGARSGFGTSTN